MCYAAPIPTVPQAGRVFKDHKKIQEEIVSQNLLFLKSEARYSSVSGIDNCWLLEFRRFRELDTLENDGCLLFLAGLKSMKAR